VTIIIFIGLDAQVTGLVTLYNAQFHRKYVLKYFKVFKNSQAKHCIRTHNEG